MPRLLGTGLPCGTPIHLHPITSSRMASSGSALASPSCFLPVIAPPCPGLGLLWLRPLQSLAPH